VDGQLVTTEPKTVNSRRTLPLSAEALTLLAEQRRAQAADRRRAANAWRETDAVFTTHTGQPMDPRNVLRAVNVAAAQLGLVGVNVHSLRHSAATAMLESGVHLKGVVSTLLGHADIRVTADTYAHLSDEVARAALAGLSRVFSGPAFCVGVNVGVKASKDPDSPR